MTPVDNVIQNKLHWQQAMEEMVSCFTSVEGMRENVDVIYDAIQDGAGVEYMQVIMELPDKHRKTAIHALLFAAGWAFAHALDHHMAKTN